MPPPPREKRLHDALDTFAHRLSLHLLPATTTTTTSSSSSSIPSATSGGGGGGGADEWTSAVSSPPVVAAQGSEGGGDTEQSESERTLVYNDFFQFLFTEEDEADTGDAMARALARDGFLQRVVRVAVRDGTIALRDRNAEYLDAVLKTLGSCMCLMERTSACLGSSTEKRELATAANGLADLVPEVLVKFENRPEHKDLARSALWCIGNLSMPFTCGMDRLQRVWEAVFSATNPNSGFNSWSVEFEGTRATKALARFHMDVIDANIHEFLACMLMLTAEDSEKVHQLALDVLHTKCDVAPEKKKDICATLLRRDDVRRAANKITTQFKAKLLASSDTSPDSVAAPTTAITTTTTTTPTSTNKSSKHRRFYAQALGPWIFWLGLSREYLSHLLAMHDVFFSSPDTDERCLAFLTWRFLVGHLVFFNPYSPGLLLKLLGRLSTALREGKEPVALVRLTAFESWTCLAQAVFSTPLASWRGFFHDQEDLIVMRFYEPLILALGDFDAELRHRAASYGARLIQSAFGCMPFTCGPDKQDLFRRICDSVRYSQASFHPRAQQPHELSRVELVPVKVVAAMLNATMRDFAPVFGEDRDRDLCDATHEFWLALFTFSFSPAAAPSSSAESSPTSPISQQLRGSAATGGVVLSSSLSSCSSTTSAVAKVTYVSLMLQEGLCEGEAMCALGNWLRLMWHLHKKQVAVDSLDVDRVVDHVCGLIDPAQSVEWASSWESRMDVVARVVAFSGGVENVLHMVERGSISPGHAALAWEMAAMALAGSPGSSDGEGAPERLALVKAVFGLPLSDACWRFFTSSSSAAPGSQQGMGGVGGKWDKDLWVFYSDMWTRVVMGPSGNGIGGSSNPRLPRWGAQVVMSVLQAVSSECLSESWFACHVVEFLVVRSFLVGGGGGGGGGMAGDGGGLPPATVVHVVSKIAAAMDETLDENFATDRVVMLAEVVKHLITRCGGGLLHELCKVLFVTGGSGGLTQATTTLARQKLELETLPVFVREVRALRGASMAVRAQRDLFLSHPELEAVILAGLQHPDLGLRALCDEFVRSDMQEGRALALSPVLASAWKVARESLRAYVHQSKAAYGIASSSVGGGSEESGSLSSPSPGTATGAAATTTRVGMEDSMSSSYANLTQDEGRGGGGALAATPLSPAVLSTAASPIVKRARATAQAVLTSRQLEKAREVNRFATYTTLDASQALVEEDEPTQQQQQQPQQQQQQQHGNGGVVKPMAAAANTAVSVSQDEAIGRVLLEAREVSGKLVHAVHALVGGQVPTQVVREDLETRENVKRAMQMMFDWVVKEGFA